MLLPLPAIVIAATMFALSGISMCAAPSSENIEALPSKQLVDQTEFASYWYEGKAELTSFQLDIIRYGELRRGEAVLIYVTEDLSASNQVKLDNPLETADEERITVMKLNELWKFKTGIYDYSMMNSVFTPVSLNRYPHTLKVTTSSQDWCGQSFTQLNRTPKGYRLQQHAYFESEGELDELVKPDMLEDELWTRIRINPGSIPEGQLNLLPGGFYTRLNHEPQIPRLARIRFESSEAATECIVEYMHFNRTLKIAFESGFPHRILSWTETAENGLQVSAVRRKTMRSAYWQQNSEAMINLRDSLLLQY